MKLSRDMGSDTRIVLTSLYNIGKRGEGNPPQDWLDRKKIENLYTSLTLNTVLGSNANLSISAHTAMRDWKYTGEVISIDWEYTDFHTRDTAHGLSARLDTTIRNHSIVAGMDYENGVVHMTDSVWGAQNRARTSRWAVYFNDTIDLGKLTITPGLRFDHDNIINDFVSPSLGLVYLVFDQTILRASVARGFSSPSSLLAEDTIPYGYKGNTDLRPEKILAHREVVWVKR